jgi:hypothetical protein
MPEVFGRENTGRLNEMVEVLERSGDLEHRIRAENMRLDAWISYARESVFERDWEAPTPSATMLYKAFDERCERRVRRPTAAPPEFVRKALCGHCHVTPGWSPGLVLRQFLSISALLTIYNIPPAQALLGDPDPLKSEANLARRIRRMARDEQQAVAREVLLWFSTRDGPEGDQLDRHPTWLTPLDQRPSGEPAPRIEARLAAVGVFAQDSVWVELRYEYWELADEIMAVAGVLDGGSACWYPAPPASVGGACPQSGFSMDLRRLYNVNRQPFSELITTGQRRYWLSAWKAAGCDVWPASAETASRICAMQGPIVDFQALRRRHTERLV